MPDDWYKDFVDEQDDRPLRAPERQELRAIVAINASTRLLRRRLVTWLKHLSIAVVVAAALSQFGGQIIAAVKWIGSKLP